jgi:hypothetical protein
MYSISNVIIGIPISEELSGLLDDWETSGDPRWREWEDLGFETFYHGGSPYAVGFCGVLLGEFNECHGLKVDDGSLAGTNTPSLYQEGDRIPLTATVEQTRVAQDKVNALQTWIREICPEFGIYIIHSTS